MKVPNKGDVVLELVLEPSSKIKEERERENVSKQNVPEFSSQQTP